LFYKLVKSHYSALVGDIKNNNNDLFTDELFLSRYLLFHMLNLLKNKIFNDHHDQEKCMIKIVDVISRLLNRFGLKIIDLI